MQSWPCLSKQAELTLVGHNKDRNKEKKLVGRRGWVGMGETWENNVGRM